MAFKLRDIDETQAPLLDHLIVGDSDRYYSFNESGSMRPTYSGLAG